MADQIAHLMLDGSPLLRADVVIPARGVWYADVDLAEPRDAALPAGHITLTVGATRATCTILPSKSGEFGGLRRVRVVGGANGWGQRCKPRSYRNDAGVKAATVIADLAAEVGETLGAATPALARLGSSYTRGGLRGDGQPITAATVLEDACRGALWWVGLDGVTYVGDRAGGNVDPEAIDVLDVDARHNEVTLACDDLAALAIGSTLVHSSLPAPLTIRSLHATIDAGSARVRAWCGPGTSTRLGDAVRALASRAQDTRLLGTYRYRVVSMSAERVDLQVVGGAQGLPDQLAVPMASGSGMHAELTPGSLAYVQFVAGDRSDPIITHFSGRGDPGHVPERLELCGGGQRVALQGGLVQCGGSGAMITLSPLPGNVAPTVLPGVPYLVSYGPTPLPQLPLYGVITTGSPKVWGPA